MTTTIKPDMLLWLDSNRGVYIPRDFAASFADRSKSVSGVSDEDWATLEAGPDHEWYWEAWMKVTDNATVTDENGVKFTVYQDGDCWLIPEGMEWSDDEGCYKWPSPENDDISERIEELEEAIEAYKAKMDDWQANADNEAELATLKEVRRLRTLAR